MPHIEFDWTTADGLRLYGQGWEPEADLRGVVCLVHGLGEHSGRYRHLSAFLNRSGYALLTFDLRGHGRSDGNRGHSRSFGHLMKDISGLLEEAERRYPGQPRFLYGHSLGGNLVLNFTLRHPPKVMGVIATGPALRPAFEPPAWKITIGKIMYNIFPSLSMSNEIDRRLISRDPEVVNAYNNDPLVHDRITARLAMDFLEAGIWALNNASHLSLPLLLLHGGEDGLTSVQATREFAERAGQFCTLKVWDGLYHEIHNDPEKEQVFAYLGTWLEERNRPRRS
ncbi:MAG: alpha/beta hydrolase [Pseudomonadota bacterium]